MPKIRNDKEDKIRARVSSLFTQLLHCFPRTEFQSLVKKHVAGYKAKGFSCWDRFVAKKFCRLAHAGFIKSQRKQVIELKKMKEQVLKCSL